MGAGIAGRVLQGVARTVRRAQERLAHPLRRRAAVRRVSRHAPPQVVLMVCHGNICRSPYAAALLRRSLAPLVGDRIRVASAGFVRPGRPCPGVAVEVAAARGLELSMHRSQLLAGPEVFAADLILVMDPTQRRAIRAIFGRSSNDVLVLGDFDPEPIVTREIRDPVEQPKEVFELSYSQIERCVGELVRAVSLSVQRAASLTPSGRDPDGERSGRQEQTA